MDYVVYWPTGIWNCMKSVHIKLRRRNCLTWSKTKTNSEPINWSFQESQMHNLGLGLREILGLGFKRWESSSICVVCASFGSVHFYKIPGGFRHHQICCGWGERLWSNNKLNGHIKLPKCTCLTWTKTKTKTKPEPNNRSCQEPRMQNSKHSLRNLRVRFTSVCFMSCQVFVCASKSRFTLVE